MDRYLVKPDKAARTEDFAVEDENGRGVFVARCPFRPKVARMVGAVAWVAATMIAPWLLGNMWSDALMVVLGLTFLALLVGPWYGPLVLNLNDQAGREIVKLRWAPARPGRVGYRIYRHGSPFGRLRSRGVVNRTWEIDALGHDTVQARGDFTSAHWSFYRREAEVGRASTLSEDPRHSYNLYLEKGEDHELLVACATLIDVAHRKRKAS